MTSGMGDLFAPDTPVITKTTMDFPKTVSGGEYLPAKVPSSEYIEKRGDKIACLHNETTVSRFVRQRNGLSFLLQTSQIETLELPLIYYKGYRAELDGKTLDLTESPDGLVEITAGDSGIANVYYAGTVIQKISVWITLLSLLALLGYVIGRKYGKHSSKIIKIRN
jgi:uncharacterized membrane protein YfhO